MTRRKSATRAAAIVAAERRVKAVELRKKGLSLREIAQVIGCSFATSGRDLRRAMKELAEQTCTNAEELRAIENERLHTLIRHSWPAVQDGDPRAIANVLRISESLRKMWGLDSPEKIDLPGGGLTVAAVQLIRTQILGIAEPEPEDKGQLVE